MYTLGINAAFHDSSACLVRDGEVLVAIEEERLTRIKHGKRPIPFSTYELPFHAIHECLRIAHIELREIDHIAYGFEPHELLGAHRGRETITLPLEPSRHPKPDEWEAAWDPLFLSSIINAPRHLTGGVPHHLKKRFSGINGEAPPFQWHFVPHHLAHAASAFYPSPFSEAATLTLDGRGEKATTTYGNARDERIELIGEVRMPHSLGLLYEQITSHLGFLHSSDEYKVMALASYGKPTYAQAFRDLIEIHGNGQFTIRQADWSTILGPPRERGDRFEKQHFDIAHSLQMALEETVVELCSWLQRETGSENLCMAGGVALNCVLNARIRDRTPFREIWIQPAAGDAGTALGAALWIDSRVREPNPISRRKPLSHIFLGPEYSDDEVEEILKWSKVSYRRSYDLASDVANLLVQGRIVGWMQGRMEFGPRALGGRSILASPLEPNMQGRLNEIKDREDFRPVAPVVLEEEAANWFIDARQSPFMLFVNDVRRDRAHHIPAVRHVDGTARIQTINRTQHPRYYDLIKAFQARTGVPILINTSFNTRGEPIVCSPRDALECFWSTPLDALAIGSFLVTKPRWPATSPSH